MLRRSSAGRRARQQSATLRAHEARRERGHALQAALADLTALDGAEAPGLDAILPAGPRMLERAVLDDLATAAEALWSALDEAVRGALAGGAEALAGALGFSREDAALIAATPSLLAAPARADFVATRKGYRLLEWNVDPCLGGLASGGLYERFVAAGAAEGSTFTDPAQALVPGLARLVGQVGRVVVAIREGDRASWGGSAERWAQAARAAGLDAAVVSVEEAARLAEAATVEQPLGVLRFFHLEHVASVRAAVARLVAASQGGRAKLIYGFDTELWGDKQWLARVPLPSSLARWVPKTRPAREMTAALLRARAAWVLKPHASAAGAGVLAGVECDAEAWRAAVEQAGREAGWVAQRKAEPLVIKQRYVDVATGRVVVRREIETLGVFIIGGRFAGAWARSQPVEEGLVVGGQSSYNAVAARAGRGASPPVLGKELRALWAAPSEATLRRRLRGFEALALEHLVEHGGAAARARPEEAAAGFGRERFPVGGTSVAELVRELRANLLPFCHDKRAPEYFAHLDVPPADLSIAAGVLTRALAQDPVTWTSSRAGSYLEAEVIRWFGELAFAGVASSGGVACAGGTQANLLAVLHARNLALGALGYDVPRLGLAEALRRAGARSLNVYASTAAHGSVVAAVKNAGLGDDNLVRIAVDAGDAMRLEALAEALDQGRRQGDLPALLVLTAGTVGVGAIDPLGPAIALGRRYGVRVHVDAAHGSMLLLSRRYAGLLAGIERADSVTADPHKLLGLNQGLGLLLLRDASDRRAVAKDPAPYFAAPDGAPDAWRYTLDGTRPLHALGAWILLRHVGRAGYERVVDHLMALAGRFVERIGASGRFEVYGAPVMNLVGFRPRRDGGDGDERVARLLDGLDGRYRASRYQSPRGAFARAVFVNPATTVAHVDAFTRRLERLA